MFLAALAKAVDGETETERRVVDLLREAREAIWQRYILCPVFIAREGCVFSLYVARPNASVAEIVRIAVEETGVSVHAHWWEEPRGARDLDEVAAALADALRGPTYLLASADAMARAAK